jgi:ubiquinone/menaquinone biosynthesis C-methylase UbiE
MLMKHHLRWTLLPVVAVSLAVGQTEEQNRRYLLQVQSALGLHAGATVADIGTGDDPYHPFHISKVVGDSGNVLCVDISEKALERLNGKLKKNGATNIKTQLGKPDDPLLPDSAFDAVLISLAYHEMPQYSSMLRHIRTALRPEGRLVVIESISEKNHGLTREGQVNDHQLSPEILEAELKAAGYDTPKGAETLVDKGGVRRYLISARVAR